MSRNYLEAFVIVLIAAGLGFFLLLPKYSKLQEVEAAVAEKNSEIENRQEYFAQLTQAAIELAQYEANLEKIETAFPEAVDAPALMNFVQSAAMQSGMIVKSIDFAGVAADKTVEKAGKKGAVDVAATTVHKLKAYGVEGEFIGNYANFKDFLARIEYSSRLISADNIAISAESMESSKVNDKKTTQTVDEEELEMQATDPVLNFQIKLSVNYYE